MKTESHFSQTGFLSNFVRVPRRQVGQDGVQCHQKVISGAKFFHPQLLMSSCNLSIKGNYQVHNPKKIQSSRFPEIFTLYVFVFFKSFSGKLPFLQYPPDGRIGLIGSVPISSLIGCQCWPPHHGQGGDKSSHVSDIILSKKCIIRFGILATMVADKSKYLLCLQIQT